MDGVKEFCNLTCFDVKVELTVRAGEQPGCVAKVEEFCLKSSESRKVAYGNELNPFLDGIRACSSNSSHCTETGLFVKARGCAADKLLNTNNHITILIAGQSLVFSGFDGPY